METTRLSIPVETSHHNTNKRQGRQFESVYKEHYTFLEETKDRFHTGFQSFQNNDCFTSDVYNEELEIFLILKIQL